MRNRIYYKWNDNTQTGYFATVEDVEKEIKKANIFYNPKDVYKIYSLDTGLIKTI